MHSVIHDFTNFRVAQTRLCLAFEFRVWDLGMDKGQTEM
jgi:hypothetical protein